MKQTLIKLKEKIFLALKSFGYSTLTEENLEKIIKRKESEIEDLDILIKEENMKIYEDLKQELGDLFSDEEIETIYRNIAKEE